MKYTLLLLLLLPTITFSQSTLKEKKRVYPLAIHTNPEFVGGEKALEHYINQNFRLTLSDQQKLMKGSIMIKFFVQEDGSVTDAKLINKGLTTELNEKALQLVLNMPKWNPATQNKKAVKTMYSHTFRTN